MHCPHCRQKLSRNDSPPFLLWACGQCGGCAATLANLRKGIQHAALQHAWNRTIGENRLTRLPCPECRACMHRVPVTAGPEIDLCRQCQVVWFDAEEIGDMPRRTAQDLADSRWAEEKRDMQRRRADSEFYDRLLQRLHF